WCVAGRNDDVKCFCCDGGLRCWESGDDPWVEHAKWFPRCVYLLQEKGQEFVHQIQARFPRLFEQVTPAYTPYSRHCLLTNNHIF
uniref:Baculoviral IAP repeat containing 2 n=1 Tax=Hucho hucho TaxID=62062 RepID=A0A4W5KT18_9TELE